MNGMEANGLAIVLPMLWVFVLMAAVVMNVVSKHKNERMNKRIGIEMELIKNAHSRDSPHEKLAQWINKQVAVHDSLTSSKTRQLLRRINVAYMGYTHEVVNQTKLVTDSSLNNGGIEIVSPPLSGDRDQRSWLSRMSSALRGVVTIDSSTSVHVHVGLRNADDGQYDPFVYELAAKLGMNPAEVASAIVGRVGYAYGYFQTVLNKLVSPSRRNGRWCRDTAYMAIDMPNPSEIILHSREWSDEEDCYEAKTKSITCPTKIGIALYEHLSSGGRSNDSRYQCVNPQAFRKYGTIEFRSHQGSTNAGKIQNWVDIVYALTQRCASEEWSDITEYDGKSYHDFMMYLGFSPSDHLYEAGVRRIRALNGGDPSVFEHDPQISHSQLFTAIPACIKCGQTTCDHDGECGTQHSAAMLKEIKNHFSTIDLEYPRRECDECGMTTAEYVQRHGGEISREYSQHSVGTCTYCEETTNFSAYGGLLLSLALGTIPLALVVVGCGIGAIHAVSQKFRHKKLASRLFKALSARGKQASGFAFENGDGVYYVKAPHSSHAMAHHTGKQLTAETKWTMMHTRYATHGVNNKANAHPHFGRLAKVTMVHNGVVHNHNAVWTALGEKPTGPVDSQAVAQCLEVGGIEKVVEHCTGSMSLIWSNAEDAQGTLKCWTNGGSPLVMGRLDDATKGPVVIASTLPLLKEGVGKRLKVDWNAVIGREYTIHPNGSITSRDIDGSEETAGITYDWRDYINQPDYYSTNGANTNYRITNGNKPAWRIIKLAKDKMNKSPTKSFRPIEGKWDGYDAVTHEGICADRWSVKGQQMQYPLAQWVQPDFYEEDLRSLLRGDYQPDWSTEDKYYDDESLVDF
tara:strand:- start:777 stop:3344 length:2568 start_codon:yes stop_codon:yes gene_type:complete